MIYLLFIKMFNTLIGTKNVALVHLLHVIFASTSWQITKTNMAKKTLLKIPKKIS